MIGLFLLSRDSVNSCIHSSADMDVLSRCGIRLAGPNGSLPLTSATSLTSKGRALLLAVPLWWKHFLDPHVWSILWFYFGFKVNIHRFSQYLSGFLSNLLSYQRCWFSCVLRIMLTFFFVLSLSIISSCSPPIGFILAATSFLVTGFCANPFLTLNVSLPLP